MRLTVQSHDQFDEFAEFDPKSNSLEFYSKKREPERWTGVTEGWYAAVGGGPAMLFRLNKELFFSHRGETIAVEDSVHARVQGGEMKRRFILTQQDQELISIDYEIPQSPIPAELDFTETNPEDFDFLLFVRNVLETPARRMFARGLSQQ